MDYDPLYERLRKKQIDCLLQSFLALSPQQRESLFFDSILPQIIQHYGLTDARLSGQLIYAEVCSLRTTPVGLVTFQSFLGRGRIKRSNIYIFATTSIFADQVKELMVHLDGYIILIEGKELAGFIQSKLIL